jgi:hypothetical protein
MSSGREATERRRSRRTEKRKDYFVGQSVVSYWACCEQEHTAFSLQHACKCLEQHESDHHNKKTTGTFGIRRAELPLKKMKTPEPRIWHIKPRITQNGMIRLDLTKPDEACLLPKEWGGKYPKLKSAARLKKLSEQQNHRCCYCGKHTWSSCFGEDGIWQDMSTIEHIRCRAHGGTNKKGNVVMACSECNNQRSRQNPIIFLYEKHGLMDWELVPKDPPVEVSEPPA